MTQLLRLPAVGLPAAGLALVGGLSLVLAGPADGQMRVTPSLPVFALEAPYGEPWLLTPSQHPLGSETPAPAIAGLSPAARAAMGQDPSGRSPEVRSRPVQPPPARRGRTETAHDGDPPGTLSRDYVKIPSPIPNIRNRSLGPHLSPDAEFDVTSRTSMGVLGRADRLDVRPGVGIVPSVRARDLGAGVVLQYKLGP